MSGRRTLVRGAPVCLLVVSSGSPRTSPFAAVAWWCASGRATPPPTPVPAIPCAARARRRSRARSRQPATPAAARCDACYAGATAERSYSQAVPLQLSPAQQPSGEHGAPAGTQAFASQVQKCGAYTRHSLPSQHGAGDCGGA